VANDLGPDRKLDDGRGGIWAAEFESSVWACAVVVVQELLDHCLQMVRAEDQEVVEQLVAAGGHEPLRDRVRARRAEWQAHNLRAFGPEDLIEVGGELGVAVAKEELGLQGTILEFPGQVPSLLSDPLAGGISGDAGEVDLATLAFDEDEDVEALKPGGIKP